MLLRARAAAAAARIAALSPHGARFLSAPAAAGAGMSRALDVLKLDPTLYLAPPEILWTPPNSSGVFGGQICAQAMHVAQQSCLSPAFSPHSLHSYFLRVGDPTKPIIYKVDLLRNGKSFETRGVVASQDGQAIFSADVSFHRQGAEEKTDGWIQHSAAFEGGIENVPAPESLPSLQERMQALLADPRLRPEYVPIVKAAIEAPFPVDVRPVKAVDVFSPEVVNPARQLVWMRWTEALGDDPAMHRSALAYASDWSLSGTSLLPHGLTFSSPEVARVASLDHSLYFHDAFRADEWMLYEMSSPILRSGRGLNLGAIWTRDGRLVVSCVQEALVRLRAPPRNKAGGATPSPSPKPQQQ